MLLVGLVCAGAACDRETLREVQGQAWCPSGGMQACACDGGLGLRPCDAPEAPCECADSELPVAPDCVLSREGDRQRLTCPDGTNYLLPTQPPQATGPCMLSQTDAGLLLRCPDGSSSVVRPADPRPIPYDPDADAGVDAGTDWPVLHGSVRIESAIDMLRITEYAEITGYLEVVAPGLVALRLPNLRKVGAQLHIHDSPDLQLVTLPALSEVGEGMKLEELPEVASVELSNLRETVSLELRQLPLLTKLDLPMLERADQLHIVGTGLDHVRLPALQELTGYSSLGARLGIEIPVLKSAHQLSVGDPEQVSVDFAALEEAGSLTLNVKTAFFPRLTAATRITVRRGDVTFEGEPEIGSITLSREWGNVGPVVLRNLKRAGKVTYSDHPNAKLPDLEEAKSVAFNYQRFDQVVFPKLRVLESITSDDARGTFSCEGVFPALPLDAYPSLSLDYIRGVDCPNLVAVGGSFIVSGDITSLHLPKLERIAGDLRLGYKIESLRLPKVTAIDGGIATGGNAINTFELPGIFAPDKTHLGGARIESAAAAQAFIDAGFEVVTGNLRVTTEDLTSLALPDLRWVTGSLIVRSNDTLDSVLLQGATHVGYALLVDGNPSLTSLALPALERARDVKICANASLPQCYGDALGVQVDHANSCYGSDSDGGTESDCGLACCPGIAP